jgi:hypothetical protein
MSDEQAKPRSDADAELEREIRAHRKFTLSEAIGRLAGPGAMKGVSPVTRQAQAVAAIEEYLNRHIADTEGVLAGVLLRRVKTSELLLGDFDHPLIVLGAYIRHVLESEYDLKELVREADVEWGRVFGERPYFDHDGRPPAEEDPYTVVSVRTSLNLLVGGLTAESA